MDVLSEILSSVKLRGTLYFHARFQSPWGMRIPDGQFANYHIVTEGECWLEYGPVDTPPRLLRKGDVVLFAHGNAHTLSDSPKTTAIPAIELMNKAKTDDAQGMVLGGDGSHSCSLICGHFEYDRETPHPIFETLPPMICVSAGSDDHNNWYATAAQLASQISIEERIGRYAVIDRLAESLLLQILVDYIEGSDNQTSFLAAVQDRGIGKALNAMHSDIAHDWNIAELANIAAMSKPVFSAKFHSMVGEPPIVYLARWRMLKAREMLCQGNIPLKYISEKVGYQSEFAFSRAFKKYSGVSPGAFRRTQEG